MRMRHNASSADASNLIYWAVAQSGGWSDAADWTTHTVPGAGTTAVISARSRTGYTVSLGKPEAAAVLRINAAAATVDDSSTLTIGHLLKLDAGEFILDAGGVLTGGQIQVANGATFQAYGGTLTDVRFEGTLNAASLTIGADTKFAGVGNQGSALIVDEFAPPIVVLGQNQLDNVNISLAGTIISEASGDQAGELLIGGDVTITQISGASPLPQAILAGAGAALPTTAPSMPVSQEACCNLMPT